LFIDILIKKKYTFLVSEDGQKSLTC